MPVRFDLARPGTGRSTACRRWPVRAARRARRRSPARMKPPSLGCQRAIVGQRRFQLRPQLGAQVELAVPARRASALRRAVSLAFILRQAAERAADEAQIARARARPWSRGPAGARGRRSPRSCSRSSRRSRRIGDQLGHGVEPGVDCRRVGQRIGEPSANSREPIAVTVRSITPNSDPSRPPSRIVRVISRLRRVASSISSVLAGAIAARAVDVLERRLLRFGQVIEHRPGRANRRASRRR